MASPFNHFMSLCRRRDSSLESYFVCGAEGERRGVQICEMGWEGIESIRKLRPKRRGEVKNEWYIIQAAHVLPLRSLRLIISEWLQNNKIDRLRAYWYDMRRNSLDQRHSWGKIITTSTAAPLKSDRPDIVNYTTEKESKNKQALISMSSRLDVCLCHFNKHAWSTPETMKLRSGTKTMKGEC